MSRGVGGRSRGEVEYMRVEGVVEEYMRGVGVGGEGGGCRPIRHV